MIVGTLFATLSAGIIAVSIFIWALFKGQFDNCEEIKFQIFREEQD